MSFYGYSILVVVLNIQYISFQERFGPPKIGAKEVPSTCWLRCTSGSSPKITTQSIKMTSLLFGAASSPASTFQTKPPKRKHPATVRCFFHVFFHAWRRERREIPITHRGSVTLTPAETGCQCINQTNGSTVTNVNSTFWGIYCGFKEDMFSFNVILWGDDLILIWHSQIHKCVAKKLHLVGLSVAVYHHIIEMIVSSFLGVPDESLPQSCTFQSNLTYRTIVNESLNVSETELHPNYVCIPLRKLRWSLKIHPWKRRNIYPNHQLLGSIRGVFQ